MDHVEVQLEEERLEAVKALLRDQIKQMEYELNDNVNHLVDINADMWDNAHHLIYDFDDVVEYQQRRTELIMHGSMAQRTRRSLDSLRRMLDSPYFGRLDFTARNQIKPNQVYIGIQSLTAKGEIRPQIYDWRAPVCSMFYDFGIGEASYKSPSGEISGQIGLKRQFKINNGSFEYMFDSDVKIDDEILQRELSMHSDSKLRTIIASIQREQNSAIRFDMNDNLIVFGAAGSGKTSIGMHRLAYQLYHQRGRIASKNMLIFSQSSIFGSYIAGIIPELGEEEITSTGFHELIQKHLGISGLMSDAGELTEYLIACGDNSTRIKGVAVKYSQNFLNFIQAYISGFHLKFHGIEAFGDVVCTGAELTARFASEPEAYSHFTRLKRLCAYVKDRLEDYFILHREEIRTNLLLAAVDANTVDAEYNRLLTEATENARKRLTLDAGLNPEKLYQTVLRKFSAHEELDETIYADTMKRLNDMLPAYEDALVMLYIKSLTGELEPDRSIRHVLVDEAQDFSLLQHRIIRRYAPDSHFTVLADVNQAMFHTINIRDKTILQDIYGGKTAELTKSYRSTRPINELAVRLLERNETEYFDRDGPRPAVMQADDMPAAILRTLSNCEEYRSIGIITKTAMRAVELHSHLGSHGIGLITHSTESFRSGILILPAALAKGLEFDCVIIPYCSTEEFRTPNDKRMLYLMCTRALHRLFIFHSGELTPFISTLAGYYDTLAE